MEDLNKYFWYELECMRCHHIESIPGPLRTDTDWTTFVLLLKKSPEANRHYKFCPFCKKMTATTLIGFDAS